MVNIPKISLVIILTAAAVFTRPGHAAQLAVIDIPTRDTTIRILLEWENDPQAIVALFTGGKGVAGIRDDGKIAIARGNFAVRTRKHLHSAGIASAVVDRAADMPDDIRGQRGTIKHYEDIGAVVGFLRKRFGAPVWLHGTSRGSVSVANAASNLEQSATSPDGVIFSASMLKLANQGNHVFDFYLDRIKMPVLILHHRDDACSVTPASEVPRFAAELKAATRLKTIFYEGGHKPRSGPCAGRHAHGFFGIEKRVLGDLAKFVLGQI